MKNKVLIASLLSLVMLWAVQPQQIFRSYAINTIITVASLADSGAGSLRDAIVAANAAFDNVLIDFSVSGTINLNTDLPYLNMTVGSITIDGANQIEIHKDYLTNGIGLRIGDGTAIVNPTNYIIRNLTFTGFEKGIVNYGDLNRFENITIEGPQTLGICDDTGEYGIAVVSRDTEDVFGVSMANNTISCYRKAILIQNTSGTTVSGNTVTNNISRANLSLVPLFNDANPCLVAGIEVQGTYALGGHPVQKNFITNNEITGNGFNNPSVACTADFRSAGIMLSLYGASPIALDTPTQLNRISGNEITNNVGDGIYVRQGADNEIFNNHIASNGDVSIGDPSSDTGNGIALVCDVGGIAAPVSGNLIYRNTIDHNADNGIFISKFCEVTGVPEAESSGFNPLVENVIYENGSVVGLDPVDDDGIGIDLQEQTDLTAFAFTSGNTNISENDGDVTEGGNQMVDTPVITDATYDSGTSTWTVEGTTDIPLGLDGSMVELYQVGCASTDLPADIETCDIDSYTADTHELGHGAGRIFLGRTYTTSAAWTITVPANVGFSGGLLTTTSTVTFNIPACTIPPTPAIQALLGVGMRLCSTSEFSANFFAEAVDPPVYSGLTSKTIIPQSIPRQGTGTTILGFSNTGNSPLTAVIFTDDLSAPDVTYVSGTCRWAIDLIPTGPSNCNFTGNLINLSGFSSVGPGSVVFVSFDFVVPAGAALGTHTNSVTVAASNGVAPPAATANFEVTGAPAPTYSGVLNKFVAPSTIAQSGTGTTIISFTNTGDDDFTDVLFTDDLDVPGVDYVAATCRWAINIVPSGSSNCFFVGDNIGLTGFSALAPSETIYVTFDFSVPADASVTTHTNAVSVSLTPATSVPAFGVNFAVIGTPPPMCSTTGASPDATFTVDGQDPGAAIEQYPGSLLLENTQPSQGDSPISFDWVVDGSSEGTSDAVTLNLSVGTHAVTHIVSDCDGSFDVRTLTVNIKAIPPSPVPAMTLHKSISPNTDLHIGDLITNVIQIDNPLTSSGFTMVDLSDELDGLSNLIPACNYSFDTFPTASSETCTVSTDGQIVLDLSAEPFTAGTTLFIRYIAAVTGTPATYDNAVSYNDSTSPVSPPPAGDSASFTVEAVSGGPSCPAVATVDASFTLNGAATPTQVIEGEPGVMSFVNASTSGDAPVDYYWYVDSTLQSESAGTLSRSISETTTFTLLKVDCDGSASMDTLTVLINDDLPPTPQPTVSPSPTASPAPTTSPSPTTSPTPTASPTPSVSPTPTTTPTPSASPSVTPTPTPSATPTTVPTTGFSVEKVIMNPLDLYSTDNSARTIKFKSTIHNLGSTTSSYNFTDTISNVFLPNAVINDLAGGLNESIPGLIRVTNISIPALSSKAVIYTVTIKADTDFPLSTFRLDTNADKDDSDFYPVRIKAARLADTSNDDPDNALDAPDGLLVNLGERGTITLDLGVNKLLVDGDGDDFAIALGQGKVSVAVSQDGRSFERVKGTKTFDLADADLVWARYIKITDSSVNTLATATVDAVCLLNLGVSVTDTSQVTLASEVRTNALTSYIDITTAFDEPLSSGDCRTPVTSTTKQARTIELAPPAPVILPISPIPTPVVIPTPVPVELPKTGPEGIILTILGTVLGGYLLRHLLIRRRQAIRVTNVEAGGK